MRRIRKGAAVFWAICIIITVSGACRTPDTGQRREENPPAAVGTVQSDAAQTDAAAPVRLRSGQEKSRPSKLADPAAKKCISDGYVLEPVLKNGVPVSHRCVDPVTGRSCDTWAYFRNECRLSD